ncbi:MAG: hypothetical protein U0359_26720 [Byssovorax sp.]
MNTRVFNVVEARSGSDIHLEMGTGIITLAPGTYHVTGFSSVAYATQEPPEMVATRAPVNAGYCRLRDTRDSAEDRDAGIVFGSVSTANVVPSLIEAYFTTDAEVHCVMEHQCGSSVADICLQSDAGGSTKHVFARISIRRL